MKEYYQRIQQCQKYKANPKQFKLNVFFFLKQVNPIFVLKTYCTQHEERLIEIFKIVGYFPANHQLVLIYSSNFTSKYFVGLQLVQTLSNVNRFECISCKAVKIDIKHLSRLQTVNHPPKPIKLSNKFWGKNIVEIRQSSLRFSQHLLC